MDYLKKRAVMQRSFETIHPSFKIINTVIFQRNFSNSVGHFLSPKPFSSDLCRVLYMGFNARFFQRGCRSKLYFIFRLIPRFCVFKILISRNNKHFVNAKSLFFFPVVNSNSKRNLSSFYLDTFTRT